MAATKTKAAKKKTAGEKVKAPEKPVSPSTDEVNDSKAVETPSGESSSPEVVAAPQRNWKIPPQLDNDHEHVGKAPELTPSQVEFWARHDATPETGVNSLGAEPGQGDHGQPVQRNTDALTVDETNPVHPDFKLPKEPLDAIARQNYDYPNNSV